MRNSVAVVVVTMAAGGACSQRIVAVHDPAPAQLPFARRFNARFRTRSMPETAVPKSAACAGRAEAEPENVEVRLGARGPLWRAWFAGCRTRALPTGGGAVSGVGGRGNGAGEKSPGGVCWCCWFPCCWADGICDRSRADVSHPGRIESCGELDGARGGFALDSGCSSPNTSGCSTPTTPGRSSLPMPSSPRSSAFW